MLRWILLAIALVAFGFVFTTRSATVLALALVVGAVALLWSLGAFLAARVDSVAQGQVTREVQLLMSVRKNAAPAKPANAAARPSDGGFLYASDGGRGTGRARPSDDTRDGDGPGDGGDGGGGGGGGGGGD